MKKSELNELLRLITRKIIKEYMASSSDLNTNDDESGDSSTTGANKDASELTSAEKSKIQRDKSHQRLTDLKQKKLELDSEKKQMDFYKKKVDQSKRYNIPQMTKDVQTLQGAKI